jgi:excisionase family DNA binding protein
MRSNRWPAGGDVPRNPGSKGERISDQPQWLDLRALQRYVCLSTRTLRAWINRPVDPLPAVRVGTKILVRRSTFDEWLSAHQITPIDTDIILKQMMASLKTKPK